MSGRPRRRAPTASAPSAAPCDDLDVGRRPEQLSRPAGRSVILREQQPDHPLLHARATPVPGRLESSERSAASAPGPGAGSAGRSAPRRRAAGRIPCRRRVTFSAEAPPSVVRPRPSTCFAARVLHRRFGPLRRAARKQSASTFGRRGRTSDRPAGGLHAACGDTARACPRAPPRGPPAAARADRSRRAGSAARGPLARARSASCAQLSAIRVGAIAGRRCEANRTRPSDPERLRRAVAGDPAPLAIRGIDRALEQSVRSRWALRTRRASARPAAAGPARAGSAR